MSKKTSRRNLLPPVVPTWPSLVLEAFEPHRGTTLLMFEIYERIAAHPSYRLRAAANKNPKARVRATLQSLRDRGVLVMEGKGRWTLPAKPESTEKR